MKAWTSGARLWGGLLFALAAAIQFERGVCGARHLAVPELSGFLQLVAFTCLVIHWLNLDSQQRQTPRVWDMGFFLVLAWPVIAPYHLVKTRGIKRAVVTLLLLFGVAIVGFMAGALIFRTGH